LQHDFLIAQCNNSFNYFENLEKLIEPVVEEELATEEEV